MISEITASLMQMIRDGGSWSVFWAVIVESIIPPIPSPIILMGSGAALIPPGIPAKEAFVMIMRVIVFPATIASAVGALPLYAAGYWGGKAFIDRAAPYLGFGWDEVERMRGTLTASRGTVLFLLRAVPVVPLSLVSAAAGLLRWQPIHFTVWTLLGAIPRCLLLGWMGWMSRDSYEALGAGVNRVEGIFTGLLIVAICGVILLLRKRAKKLYN